MPKVGVFLTPEASKKIKRYLKQNNLSQEEFAENLKVSSKTLIGLVVSILSIWRL